MRLKLVIYFVIFISILLLVRVYYLSIKSNTYYEQLSVQNYIKKIYTTSPRGAILDRNGVYLAINKIGFSISVKPHLRGKKHKAQLDKILHLIEHYFPKYKYKKLYRKYKKYDSAYMHEYIKVVDYIPYNQFFKYYSIFNLDENIKISSATKRFYPYKDVAAHILGYTGRINLADIKKDPNKKYYSTIGRSGLEKYYNDILEGSLGVKTVKVNSVYKIIEILNETKSTVHDIQTTIDIRLQKYIHKLFDKKSGAVVVMDIQTGELLAASSLPEFDNNLFVNGISHKDWNSILNDFNHPFTNKLVNGKYPPGSVIKMGMALSFLQNNISPKFTVDCNGSLILGKRNFRCWKTKGHKITGFRKAIRESCDDFFYKGSLEVGINNIHKTLDTFGIGRKTGIDLPREFKGINPDKQWKKSKYHHPWYVGETVVASIGQGFINVTPMQIARYTAGLATNKLQTPHLLKDSSLVKSEDLNVSKRYLNIIRKGMWDVTHHPRGTATHHIKSKIDIAAKTGTAQVVGIPQSEKKRMKEHELEYFKRSQAWLTTYAPFKHPQYVVTILVEHGGHGGSAAGPMASKIYDKLIELGYIK